MISVEKFTHHSLHVNRKVDGDVFLKGGETKSQEVHLVVLNLLSKTVSRKIVTFPTRSPVSLSCHRVWMCCLFVTQLAGLFHSQHAPDN